MNLVSGNLAYTLIIFFMTVMNSVFQKLGVSWCQKAWCQSIPTRVPLILVLALTVNIRLDQKRLPVKNTLAYYVTDPHRYAPPITLTLVLGGNKLQRQTHQLIMLQLQSGRHQPCLELLGQGRSVWQIHHLTMLRFHLGRLQPCLLGRRDWQSQTHQLTMLQCDTVIVQ